MASGMFDFHSEEDRDGVRLTWNCWPSNPAEAARLVVPIAASYSPLKPLVNVPQLPYEPVACKGTCRSLLNPFCQFDPVGKLWVCPFCFQRNQFPPQYADISQTNLPAELIPNYTTIEYALPRALAPPPVLLFVVDLCLPESDLSALKASILQTINNLPETVLVGLITFAATIQVFELAFEHCPKSFVFSGNKETSKENIQRLLGLTSGVASGGRAAAAPGAGTMLTPPRRFIMPLSECSFNLETILEELQHAPPPSKPYTRHARATGVAALVGAALVEAFPHHGGRCMFFIGGPCTSGPGLVVSEDLKEPIRAHHDIQRDQCKHMAKASKFYEGLAAMYAQSSFSVDIYGCAGDQVGVLEMQALVTRTGGVILLADSFQSDMFKESFLRLLSADDKGTLNLAFNSTVDVVSSREVKVCGAIGHVTSMQKKASNVAETEIGVGSTASWKLNTVDRQSTFCFYFETAKQPAAGQPPQHGFLQFITQYHTSSGQRMMRVTTLRRVWSDQPQMLQMGFDQEAAAVMMARIGVHKMASEDSADVLRWLDRTLIRLCAKFGDYRKDDPTSFSLKPAFSLYPQFMFHLRRGPVLQVFNNSPDETTFIRSCLNHENVNNALVMIQPTLDAYTFDGPPKPVLLSATSVAVDRILVLDTFFHVVIFAGEQIANWRNLGYHNQPDFENFKQLLEAPIMDVQTTLNERFPMPRFIQCDQGTSQARFLIAVIDPSITHTSVNTGQGETVFTEDVNLEVFMEHLKRLAVQSSS